jgi:maleate isomerase
VSSNDPLQAIADKLQVATGAGRTTIRLDVQGDFFPVAAETLTPGARSFRDYSMAWVKDSPTPIYDVVSRERKMLVQIDCTTDERPPPNEIVDDYGVRAQMLAPVVRGDRLVGIVAVHELRGPRHWTAEDIAALELAVKQVGQLLEGRG